jgi:uncharacterized protein YndB with AHSA1/START domain
MKSTDTPIVVEQNFDISLRDVWKAITELEQMKQWFFENIEAFEPEVGFQTKFEISIDGRVFPHHWKIKEVEAPRKITYNWKYEGYAGDSDVCFELFEAGENTKLKLTHIVSKDFPASIPEFSRDSCIGGWNYFIKQRLNTYLKLKSA